MPQSLAKILVHTVFSTKERRPYLRDKALREELHHYLGGILTNLDCQPIIVGGAEDHVHILCALSRTCDRFMEAEWDDEVVSVFEMRHAGWVVSTLFDYGRREGLIDFNHFIDSESKIPRPKQPEVLLPEMRLEQHMRWLCFHRWTHLEKGEVAPVCDMAAKISGYFYEAVPKLLEGLECDKISRETGRR